MRQFWRFGLVCFWTIGIGGCVFEETSVESAPVAPGLEIAGGRAHKRAFSQVASSRGVALTADAAPLSNLAAERKVIKSAGLDVEIEDHKAWLEFARKLIEQDGGYVVDSSVQQAYENVKHGKLTGRVPQQKLDAVLAEFKKRASKIEREHRGGQDVTEEYFDLDMRLENKRKTEKRFQEILKTAKRVEDVLAVERELSRVRGEIERLEGRQRFFDNRIELASVVVNWHEPYPLGSGTHGKRFWEVVGQGFPKGVKGLAQALQGVIALAIGLGPVLLGLGVVLWLLLYWAKRRRSKS